MKKKNSWEGSADVYDLRRQTQEQNERRTHGSCFCVVTLSTTQISSKQFLALPNKVVCATEFSHFVQPCISF